MGILDAVMARGVEATGLQGTEEVFIAASPDRVYRLVSDVTRMGEWSPECYHCHWLGGVSEPALGARFKGYNRRGWFRWSMVCTVTEAEPGRAFAFETKFGSKVQSRWRYQLEPAEGGTLLKESFQGLWVTYVITRLFFGGLQNRRAQMEEGVRHTLQRIKAVAEAEEGHGGA